MLFLSSLLGKPLSGKPKFVLAQTLAPGNKCTHIIPCDRNESVTGLQGSQKPGFSAGKRGGYGCQGAFLLSVCLDGRKNLVSPTVRWFVLGTFFTPRASCKQTVCYCAGVSCDILLTQRRTETRGSTAQEVF